jgi:hypothetical protein
MEGTKILEEPQNYKQKTETNKRENPKKNTHCKLQHSNEQYLKLFFLFRKTGKKYLLKCVGYF